MPGSLASSAACRLLTCRWELKVASFKVPQVPSFGEAQFKDCGRGMRCKSAAVVAAIAGKREKPREIRRRRKQIFERKITVTAARSLDVGKTE